MNAEPPTYWHDRWLEVQENNRSLRRDLQAAEDNNAYLAASRDELLATSGGQMLKIATLEGKHRQLENTLQLVKNDRSEAVNSYHRITNELSDVKQQLTASSQTKLSLKNQLEDTRGKLDKLRGVHSAHVTKSAKNASSQARQIRQLTDQVAVLQAKKWAEALNNKPYTYGGLGADWGQGSGAGGGSGFSSSYYVVGGGGQGGHNDSEGIKSVKAGRFDLLPPKVMTRLAEHFGKGDTKYPDRNWEKGYAWSKAYAAMQRHAHDFWGGKDFDEDGNSNIIAVIANAIFLEEWSDTHPEYDDRPKPTEWTLERLERMRMRTSNVRRNVTVNVRKIQEVRLVDEAGTMFWHSDPKPYHSEIPSFSEDSVVYSRVLIGKGLNWTKHVIYTDGYRKVFPLTTIVSNRKKGESWVALTFNKIPSSESYPWGGVS